MNTTAFETEKIGRLRHLTQILPAEIRGQTPGLAAHCFRGATR